MTDVEFVASQVAQRVDPAMIRDLVGVLTASPCPWGSELAAAEVVEEWIHARHLDNAAVTVTVTEISPDRGNLMLRAGVADNEIALCSHLDTSLTGVDDRDVVLTGYSRGRARRSLSGRALVAPGLAVARGPAAAATVGCLSAISVLDDLGVGHRTSLLLAAGGTHRRRPPVYGQTAAVGCFADGVRFELEQGWRPKAAVVAKAGPPVVLHEEPGSAYVDVEISGTLAPGFLRTDHDRGLAGHVPRLISAIEEWRDGFVAIGSVGQIGREAVIGAIQLGCPEKPDLLPARARICLYVVLSHGDDASGVARDLERHITTTLPAADRPGVDVSVGSWAAAGRTPPDAEIVKIATEATGLDTATTGWRGSTDGAVLRAAGIDTVRWGPTIHPDSQDPRADEVELEVLADAARTYGDIVARFAIANTKGAS